MSDWRIFWWARLHSAEFKYCYIILPIRLRCRWSRDYLGWSLSFGLSFHPPGVYVPYSVRESFYAAHKDDPAVVQLFDDIPF